MTLLSNASEDVFIHDTSSCYIMDLTKAIELRGEWLVGLCEVIYPHIWYNLQTYLFYFGKPISIENEDMERTSRDLASEQEEEKEIPLQYTLLTGKKFGRGGYFNRPKVRLNHFLLVLRGHSPNANLFYNMVTRKFYFQRGGYFKIFVFVPLAYMPSLKAKEL